MGARIKSKIFNWNSPCFFVKSYRTYRNRFTIILVYTYIRPTDRMRTIMGIQRSNLSKTYPFRSIIKYDATSHLFVVLSSLFYFENRGFHHVLGYPWQRRALISLVPRNMVVLPPRGRDVTVRIRTNLTAELKPQYFVA